MNEKERNNIIEQESFKMLLEEFTKEQEVHNKYMNELVATINGLSTKVASLETKLHNPQPVKVHIDTATIEQVVGKGIKDMKIIASAKPQPVIKKWQILLFPEKDAKQFYRIVFGRWFLWLVIIFFLSCLYKFGIHWSDNQQQMKLEQLENDKIKKAWIKLYGQENKAGKQHMDKMYEQSR
ncbi:hypothetical protein A9P82_08855 [Arachidicoccus ginsenosidimutans]|uniref:hypothetical protein n=1 Tax=Arachidicoccus sp. BS20 TaxID=1850526 RepID=UPI0007F11989|nr:hypothetical protein [Arachidicoccus sp. BS20]ANI89392.1 hypothetical protein A9P82_08855 [Arachidicoccus sp. BS20]